MALYQALPRLGPRLTILMVHCLAAPFAALTEWLWIGTPLTAAQIVSGLVILTGVAIALTPQEHLHIAPKVLAVGMTLGVVAALGQGMGAVVSRKAYAVIQQSSQHIDGLTAAYQRILGGLIFAALPSLWVMVKNGSVHPSVAIEGEMAPGARVERRRVWPWVLLNSLAGPTMGVGCYQWALETTPSGVVLPIVATTPIVVIPFAYFFEGDRPGARSLIGGMIAVAGAISLTLAR
jgi:drug/metabolite transporter (DMT)-like permease